MNQSNIQKPKKRRIGFLKGKISIPADFDSMGKEEIEKLFYGKHRNSAIFTF